MNIINLLLLISIVLISNQNKEIYKNYRGGRAGFSFVELTLYQDSTYKFKERFDFPGYTRDSGNWTVSKSKLFLNSFTKSNKFFNEDSFLLKDKVLYLFDHEEDSSFNMLYRTLKSEDY